MAQFRLRRAGAALAAIAAMAMGGGGLLTAVQAAAPAAKPATADQVADAKAQIAAAGVACDVGNVRFVGENTVKGAKGNVQAQTYEVTCANRYGYVVQGPKGGSAETTAYSCPGLKASSDPKKKSVQCELPENLDLKPAAQLLGQKAGLQCTVQNAKWRGLAKSGAEFVELACAPGQPGYLLSVPKGPETPTAQNCMQLNGAKCELTTDAQSNAWLADLASKSGKSCQVTKSRFVGVSQSDNTEYYEVGCAQGAGFMLALDTKGALKRTVQCADASGIAGGCTLTDKSLVQASALQNYGERLKPLGIACNVQKARLVGTTRNKEDVVEYACSDRPAGLIVAFSPKPDVVDCLNSRHFGIQCEFTPRPAQLDLLTKALATAGKSCTVSDFQNLGETEAKTIVFEVACGSAPGYIAEIHSDYSKVRKADTCAEAAKTANKTGLSCTIAGNH